MILGFLGSISLLQEYKNVKLISKKNDFFIGNAINADYK